MSAHHGNTPAAWTCVTIVLIGFIVGGLGLVLDLNMVMFWIGIALMPIGLIVGVAMAKLGYGAEQVVRS